MGSLLAAPASVDTINKAIGELSRQPSGLSGPRYFSAESKWRGQEDSREAQGGKRTVVVLQSSIGKTLERRWRRWQLNWRVEWAAAKSSSGVVLSQGRRKEEKKIKERKQGRGLLGQEIGLLKANGLGCKVKTAALERKLWAEVWFCFSDFFKFLMRK
jgi:hypothetical protein